MLILDVEIIDTKTLGTEIFYPDILGFEITIV